MKILNKIDQMERFVEKNLPKNHNEMITFLSKNNNPACALGVSLSSNFSIEGTYIKIGFDLSDPNVKEALPKETNDFYIMLKDTLQYDTGLDWTVLAWSEAKVEN